MFSLDCSIIGFADKHNHTRWVGMFSCQKMTEAMNPNSTVTQTRQDYLSICFTRDIFEVYPEAAPKLKTMLYPLIWYLYL